MVPEGVPRFGRKICLRVNKGMKLPAIDPYGALYINSDLFPLFGIMVLQVLGELPSKVRIGPYFTPLFRSKPFFKGDHLSCPGFRIHYPKLQIAPSGPQHHPPTHPVPFFGPEHISGYKVMA